MHPHMQIKQHPWYRGADLAAEPAEPEQPEQPAGIEGNGGVGTWAEEGPRDRGKGGAPRETMRLVPVFIPVVVPVDRSGRKEGEKGRKGKAR